jgi:H+/Cl- antiporter ClcA
LLFAVGLVIRRLFPEARGHGFDEETFERQFA